MKVGGGAAGVELAFAVHKRLSPCQLTLVTAAPDIIAERSWWTRSVVSSKLRHRGIEILTSRRCTEVRAQSAVLDNGNEIPTNLVLWATGAAPSSLLAKLRVPLCDQGWIKACCTFFLSNLINPT